MTLYGIRICPKIGKRCIQKIIVRNGQIILKFFYFQKFCVNLAFLRLSQVESKTLPGVGQLLLQYTEIMS